MKKIIALAFILSLTACGGGDSKPGTAAPSSAKFAVAERSAIKLTDAEVTSLAAVAFEEKGKTGFTSPNSFK